LFFHPASRAGDRLHFSGGNAILFCEIFLICTNEVSPPVSLSALHSGTPTHQAILMQKATPLVLVLVLAGTATILTLRSGTGGEPPPAASESATPQVPASDEPPPTVKTDTAVAASTPRPWPHDISDIPPDEKAIFGTLDNGMRYIVYPNAEPPGRVSLRLHIDAGSLMEADDQQGLAHFLEHMVFNGSKNYTAAELVPRMQRLGISFGAHANAYTSFDETVYMLDLPDVSEETMDLAFTVMRDFGDGALLEIEEIDKERGVILSEKVSRDTVGFRLMQKQFETLLPDSLLTKRFPIGTEDVIKGAPRDRFVDFYTRYYTPQRMTFIAVGDVDPEVLKERIEQSFASMSNPEAPGEDPDLGPVRLPNGLETSVFADREVSSTDVSLMLVREHVKRPDTTEKRTADLPLGLAHAIISRRLQRISEQEGSPIASGSASNSELFNYLDLASIDVTATDDRWQEAVPVLEKEFRRAIEHGFTESELTEAKSNLLNAYEQAVQQKPTRRSEGIATVLARSINDDAVFNAPEVSLEITKAALEKIDPAACHSALKVFWDAPGMHLVLTTKEQPEHAEQELATLFEESAKVPVEPLEARVVEAFAYTDFGAPGEIASMNEVEDLGITQLVLSNNVRVNLKPTDFEKNRIRVVARIGTGKLSQPKDAPMLADFASAVFEGGALGKHSNDELQQILAGRNVGAGFGIGDDAFTLGGSTTPADFTLQMQLMAATLTDPGYRNEGLWQFQKALPMIYQQLRHTPAGPQAEMTSWLHGGDARFSLAPMETVAAYTIDDARKWLNEELAGSYLELSIVGDFEIEKILPDILATFGALPTRANSLPELPEARRVKFPEAPAEKTFTYESKIEQAIAVAVWKTAGIRGNQREFRRLNILSEIYGDRLREEIREKLGASYSPNAGAAGSDALEDVGYLIGMSVGKPEDIKLLLDTMRNEADELAREGATEDQLQRALKPALGQLDRSLRDNGYWLGTVISQSQHDPERLELARNRSDDYRSITLEEINALAKKYFTADNALLVSILPVAGEEPAETEE
jgi:zinc protease